MLNNIKGRYTHNNNAPTILNVGIHTTIMLNNIKGRYTHNNNAQQY